MNELSDHLHPSNVRYLSSACINADNTMSRTNSETHLLSDEIQSLTDKALEEAEEHGETFYIYECRLVRKVVPGKPRVVAVKNRSKS